MLLAIVVALVVGFQRSRIWAWAAAALLSAWGCGDRFQARAPEAPADGGSPGGELSDAGAEAGGTADLGGSSAGGESSTGGASGGSGKSSAEEPPPQGGTGVGGRGGRDGGSAGSGSAGSGGSAGNGSAGSGGSGGTSPIPLDGLELWLDARVGVTETAGAVSGWKDRSTHQRHAFQYTTSSQPLLVADGLGGKPTLVFDGMDDYLSVPTLPGDFSAGVTLIAVGRTDATDCMGYFEASNGTEKEDVHLGFWDKRYLYEVAEPYLSPPPAQVLGEPEIVVAVHRPTANDAGQGNAALRRNGALLGEQQFALPVANPREHVYVGKTEYGGCTTLKGRVSEVLVYSRGLSALEVRAVEAALQQKWACCTE